VKASSSDRRESIGEAHDLGQVGRSTRVDATDRESGAKTVLLVSGKVLHYRVSLYNYFWRRFRESGWDFRVVAASLERGNQRPIDFDLRERRPDFRAYRQLINEIRPDVVILFLHLKDPIIWPLIHWLKWKGIPVISWSKGANLDEPDGVVRRHLFGYIQSLSDALLLYSANEMNRVAPKNRHKAVAANNTINTHDIPDVRDTREQIKADFQIPFQKFVLFAGTMGVNGERKKAAHLVEAFRGLDRTDVGAVIVGSGMPENLQARMNPSNTMYLGALHDPQDLQISRLFKAADLFVVPGHVGLGINQAFYWGLPVVTEMGGQPPEIHLLKSGRNGFLVPKDDIRALTERILRLLDDDSLRAEFSKRARQDVRANASTEGMYQAFLAAVHTARK
jgi:glycosyltransferase involved in cell wall biosynthesis